MGAAVRLILLAICALLGSAAGFVASGDPDSAGFLAAIAVLLALAPIGREVVLFSAGVNQKLKAREQRQQDDVSPRLPRRRRP